MGTNVSTQNTEQYGPTLLSVGDDFEPTNKLVPTMFKWPYDARKVYITGSFNEWKERIPMNRVPDEKNFVTILNVPRGKHTYKFIVDDEFKIDPNQETEKDSKGNLNNVIIVDEEVPDLSSSENSSIGSSPPKFNKKSFKLNQDEGDEYGQEEREFFETLKQPPVVPPHLRFTPLNAKKNVFRDPFVIPVPLFVTLGHVYFAKRGNVNCTGVTSRYREKFSTVVLYTPSSPSNTKKEENNMKEEEISEKLDDIIHIRD